MAMKFKIGAAVRQVVPSVEGMVVGKLLLGDDVHYRVRWMDAAGNAHERAFSEEELEAAAPQEDPTA